MLKGILIGSVVTYILLQRNPQYLNTRVLTRDISNKLRSLTAPPPQPAPPPEPEVMGPFGYIKKIFPVQESQMEF